MGRALRLLAKKSPNFFTYGNNPIAKLPDYLDSILKKMYPIPVSSANTTVSSVTSSNGTKTGKDHKERASLMLKKWAEMEGEGATKEEITYVLERLKMSHVLESVFT